MAKIIFNCVFCGIPCGTKAARRKHNIKCEKNVKREANAARSRRATEERKKWEAENPIGCFSPDEFSDLFDDLPDGAFFAMAEEHGIQPEDFIK